jgi:hypothetical protein
VPGVDQRPIFIKRVLVFGQQPKFVKVGNQFELKYLVNYYLMA